MEEKKDCYSCASLFCGRICLLEGLAKCSAPDFILWKPKEEKPKDQGPEAA